MGAKTWEKPPVGPDWTDVFVMMKAIEELHRVLVTACFTSTVYDGPAGILVIAAYSMQDDAPVMGTPVMAMSGVWPCPEHKTLEACLYAGLYRLDSGLSEKVWQQIKLPFTAE